MSKETNRSLKLIAKIWPSLSAINIPTYELERLLTFELIQFLKILKD